LIVFYSTGTGTALNEDYIPRLVSTLLGILLAYLVSGWHIFHIFLEILINAAVILLIDARYRNMAFKGTVS
jgi:hypothetical protein